MAGNNSAQTEHLHIPAGRRAHAATGLTSPLSGIFCEGLDGWADSIFTSSCSDLSLPHPLHFCTFHPSPPSFIAVYAGEVTVEV